MTTYKSHKNVVINPISMQQNTGLRLSQKKKYWAKSTKTFNFTRDG